MNRTWVLSELLEPQREVLTTILCRLLDVPNCISVNLSRNINLSKNIKHAEAILLQAYSYSGLQFVTRGLSQALAGRKIPDTGVRYLGGFPTCPTTTTPN